jgi:hypothetical protein
VGIFLYTLFYINLKKAKEVSLFKYLVFFNLNNSLKN